jgi:hypothetical protein
VAATAAIHSCTKQPHEQAQAQAARQRQGASPQKNATVGIAKFTPDYRQSTDVDSFPTRGASKAEFFKALAEYAQANGQAAVPDLKALLNDADWQVRCAALRALAATGSEEAIQILKSYVSDQIGLEEAAQASMALGDVPDPAISGFLMERYRSVSDEDLKSCLLETLAARPYGETVSFFQDFLTAPATDTDSKAEILRALGFHGTAPNEILLTHVFDKDPVIRAAAFDAIAFRRDQALGQSLVQRLPAESDASARQSLYKALAAQSDLAPENLEALARAESLAGPKIRANYAWASSIARRGPDAANVATFERIAIPELMREALENPDPGEQRAALQALAASRIPAAASALETISQTTRSPRLSSLASELSKAIAPKSFRNTD